MKVPCLVSLFISLALAPTLASAAPATLRVRADPWMPFNGTPDASTSAGYVVELLQRVFGAERIEYRTMAWENALAACRAGEIDGVLCASREEAEGLALGVECIAEVKYAVFLKKSTELNFTSYSSLKGHRIGVAPGYRYWEALDAIVARKSREIISLNSDNTAEDGVTRLARGDIELYPEALPVFYWVVKQLGLPSADFRMVAMQPGDPIFVAFRNDADGRRWAAEFDAGMQRLRADGTLQKILGQYGLADWK